MAVLSAALFALLPKCPLCFAAYLSAAGFGVAIATPMYWGLRVASLLIAVLALVRLSLQVRRRRGVRLA